MILKLNFLYVEFFNEDFLLINLFYFIVLLQKEKLHFTDEIIQFYCLGTSGILVFKHNKLHSQLHQRA